MKFSRIILTLLTGLLFACFTGPVFATALGVAPVVGILGTVGASIVLSFVPMPSGIMPMAIQKEIWERDIVESLFANNQFLNHAFNADEYVLAGKVVHIPQSGGPGNVVKNRNTLPATVIKRTDTDIVYALDEYTSDPILIPNADTVELSYDKRRSVLSEEQSNLNQSVAEEMLFNWAGTIPAGYVIQTTGADVPATAPGATGNRKAAVIGDLQRAQVMMNRLNIPEAERFALVPSDLIPQLFPADDLVTATIMNQVTAEERAMGVIGVRHGFRIMQRSSVMLFDGAGDVKAPGAAADTADDQAILCWQKNSVERALGDVKFFEDMGKPEYYGDVYSMLVRMGGRPRRSDSKGIIAIKQAKSV